MSMPQAQFTDEELARRAQAGSLPPFEELVLRYEGRIIGFLTQCCRNPSDAADLTQDTFVTAFRKLSQYDPSQPFAPWLFTIARRKWIDWVRSRKKHEDAELPELPDENDPAVLLARREDQQAIWDLARAALPDLQFQALWLRYAEDLKVEEVARVLRRTTIHVKVLLFRARATLAKRFTNVAAPDWAAPPRPEMRPPTRINPIAKTSVC